MGAGQKMGWDVCVGLARHRGKGGAEVAALGQSLF